MKTDAGFPTSSPDIHVSDVESMKFLIGVAIFSNLFGLPNARPSYLTKSLYETYGGPFSGIAI